ncbi:MAG: hypothetical protein AUK30_04795 [Nitrospirae bacterium CG2_30_70_394]|nr:response regulator [Deltaproteobacteria bacterium]OIP65370.1 MAG: hypothetical protein AUK30_04795 [Nitrospirae bacterium CG2_30_70_394]PIX83466.1 MAG: response regulator [Nitrospirae bacterium CG_4_10_14_3_um_filter_70_108]PJB94624.1 MAG: response regulator [Nitrospirae bacterium CG_4_9_14_0_8_um_filter_70_14]
MATILAVDDDPQVRDLLDTLLTEAGHQVVTAADGKEAMARFRAQPVAVVVADILMPEQDGFETIQQLHRIAPRVPVIAISGGGHNPAALYLKTATLFGAFRTLEKPFPRTALLAAVRDALA